MNLPEQYRRLLSQYDQLVSLSETILAELNKAGSESNLNSLVEKKKTLGESIARLTRQIASSRIKGGSGSNLKALSEMKDLLQQVTEKATLLQRVEEKIQVFLRKKDQP